MHMHFSLLLSNTELATKIMTLYQREARKYTTESCFTHKQIFLRELFQSPKWGEVHHSRMLETALTIAINREMDSYRIEIPTLIFMYVCADACMHTHRILAVCGDDLI